MNRALVIAAGLLLSGTAVAAFRYAPTGPVADEVSSHATFRPDTAPPGAPGGEAVAVWQRPAGPVRIALQAGHWKAAEAPDEQARLRTNGTRGGGKQEWEVNLEIAGRTAKLLEQHGYEVEILPTTIPPGYWADLFISIHADGHPSGNASGFRAAAPRRDATGRAADFVRLLERTYGEATGLPYYPTVTRRMTGYYAFNSRRYTHALHPMTTGVILETGFLTSARDRRVIVDRPEVAAKGIADAVRLYLATVDLEAKVVEAAGY
jgi:hypothetical protein